MNYHKDMENHYLKMPVSIPIELKPLIGGFLGRRYDEASEIEALLSDGNFAAVASIAHKMKGNGAAYGFEAISKMGLEMEFVAKREEAESLLQMTGFYRELILQLQSEYVVS